MQSSRLQSQSISEAVSFRRYQKFINRKYVSRRSKQFDENESDFSDEETVDAADQPRPNHKFRKYSAIFNNLMNSKVIHTPYSVVSMIISFDNLRINTIIKKSEFVSYV